MSDSQTFGFAKLVPGFDFLQNLAKGAGGGLPQMTQLSSWIAPTLNVEELDKRIQELRAVHFWLEQNGKALSATIQALEVQKMTLSTLQGMNLSMNELAESLQVKPGAMASAFASPASAPAPGPSSGPSAADSPAASSPRKATQPSGSAKTAGKSAKAAQGAAGAGTAAVDPLQWWGALSNQFQQIAAATLKDVAQAGAQAAPASAAAPGAAGTSGRRPAPAAKSKAAKASKAAKSTTGTRAPRSPAKPRSRAAPSA